MSRELERMMNRRNFLGLTAGAGAALMIPPHLLRALQQSQAQLIHRAIPSTGEKIPVVGLSFSNHPLCGDPVALRDALQTFYDNGGRVFDAMHGSVQAEQFHIAAATELRIQNKVFWSMPATEPGDPGGLPHVAVKAHVDSLLSRLRVPKLDLVMLAPRTDPGYIAALMEEKRAGRVRYIGVQVITDSWFDQVEDMMRSEPIDFIGVNYAVHDRKAEEKLLPLALKRKIGVMAFFPFGNNGGASCASGSNLFARVGNRPLPEWAAEFDAGTWAQFFIKYVISHPAVTVARVGTTKATHMLDNIGGGIGRLPNETTRKRMAALIDSMPHLTVGGGRAPQVIHAPPGTLLLSTAILDRYVGQYRTSGGTLLTFRRYGTWLTARPGSDPETVIHAQSETRFSRSRDFFIEFQLDSAGTVTGLILEQGGRKTSASRIRP
jgi:aryl-alcohol dehydrogenase-like predicted oxidoreductase